MPYQLALLQSVGYNQVNRALSSELASIATQLIMDSGKRPCAALLDQMGLTDKLKEKGSQISRSMFARPVQALSKMAEPVMMETFGAPSNMNQPGKDGSAPTFVSTDKVPSPKPWRPSHAAEIIFGNPSDKQRISGLAAGDLAQIQSVNTKDAPQKTNPQKKSMVCHGLRASNLGDYHIMLPHRLL